MSCNEKTSTRYYSDNSRTSRPPRSLRTKYPSQRMSRTERPLLPPQTGTLTRNHRGRWSRSLMIPNRRPRPFNKLKGINRCLLINNTCVHHNERLETSPQRRKQYLKYKNNEICDIVKPPTKPKPTE